MFLERLMSALNSNALGVSREHHVNLYFVAHVSFLVVVVKGCVI